MVHRVGTARTSAWTAAIAAIASIAVLVSCSSSDEAPSARDDTELADLDGLEAIDDAPVDPFCEGMRAIADDDSLSDADLASRYRELSPTVPAGIRADFEAVISALTLEAMTTEPSTTDPEIDPAIDDAITGEVAPEPLDPAEVVAAYVEAHCRSTSISPLPAPTAPD